MKNPFKKFKTEEELEEELMAKQNQKQKHRYLNPNAKAFIHKFLRMME